MIDSNCDMQTKRVIPKTENLIEGLGSDFVTYLKENGNRKKEIKSYVRYVN